MLVSLGTRGWGRVGSLWDAPSHPGSGQGTSVFGEGPYLRVLHGHGLAASGVQLGLAPLPPGMPRRPLTPRSGSAAPLPIHPPPCGCQRARFIIQGAYHRPCYTSPPPPLTPPQLQPPAKGVQTPRVTCWVLHNQAQTEQNVRRSGQGERLCTFSLSPLNRFTRETLNTLGSQVFGRLFSHQ